MHDTSGHDDRIEDVEALLREIEPADFELVAPPADLWDGIEAAIGLDALDEATVVSLDRHRSRFMQQRFVRPLLAAAAAIAIVAAGAVIISSIRGGDNVVVATAQLAFDPDAFDPLGSDASAGAELVEHDGRYEIRLTDANLPDPDANDLELWLIAVGDDGALDVQPVSLVDPESPGTYAVPAGLDPAQYSIVDISIEPRDGDAAHSGRSILRGTLADA
jgi:Anti-sigma-K factor rskA, C-terminal